jgi:hypothetical protein
MKTLLFHHDYTKLPLATETIIPVHMYGLGHHTRQDLCRIGHPLIEKIKRLGVQIDQVEMDFLTIALAITAADTFVHRDQSADGWTRLMHLQIPVWSADPWKSVQAKLEKTLHFLSGDIWKLDFVNGGFVSPEPYQRKDRFETMKLKGIDCISLLSGGLDSAIGAIDILHEGKKPLFISHAYRGDKKHQGLILNELVGSFSVFAVNADPHQPEQLSAEISMRTRSLNFIAFSLIGASAVRQVNQLGDVSILIPENGLISINAPLTPRRIGSLSTRTTHPYYIGSLQSIFDDLSIKVELSNPYQFLTKGEMVSQCKNPNTLKTIIDLTVSCSHWKRKNIQCGCCLPCLIRRAAIAKGSQNDTNHYLNNDLKTVIHSEGVNDDLFAVLNAIKQLKKKNIKTWILDSGPLPNDYLNEYQDTFVRGITEVGEYLSGKGIM